VVLHRWLAVAAPVVPSGEKIMLMLAILILGLSVALAVPLGHYLKRVLDRPASNAVDRLFDSGPSTWKSYAWHLLAFNTVAFLIGFAVLSFQHLLPLNPDSKGALAPSTVFNTAISFLTNTNLQHYSGEVHLTYFSQLVSIGWKQFISPAIGLSVLLAIIRALRGDAHLGSFTLDVWRCVLYVMLPLSLILATLLLCGGVPMTLEGAVTAKTYTGTEQTIARGPVAAIVAIKQLGTNGGGFFGVNSCHPFENPNAFTNIAECVAILLLPMACVVLFGAMLKAPRQSAVIFTVMMSLLVALTCCALATDTLAPNPGLIDLPVDQRSGNLEGKELRFGTGAGPIWATATTATSNGSVNCMHDSLNPLAGLAPLTGLWLNCIFGGVGVGLINFLIYLVVAVFLAGLMVGRTPEYLGKKVEAREIKLAMLALLIHPFLTLAPTALGVVSDWGKGAMNNPGAHGLSEVLYEFSSSSANNGSGFEGLADTVGVTEADDSDLKDEAKRPDRLAARERAVVWDILTGIVMMLGRFIPIIAPLALAASLSSKKPTPFTVGTLRTDTLTFGFMLLGTILLVGALLFLPAAALGPITEHLQMTQPITPRGAL
jgi:potassium-transporting ATPase potassium-binding subunit